MKRPILFGATLCAAIIVGVAAMQQQQGIHVTKTNSDEPVLSCDEQSQTSDWLNFKTNGRVVFELPSTGVLPATYGGTGTNTAGATIPVLVVFTGTNGVTYTNRIINGQIR